MNITPVNSNVNIVPCLRFHCLCNTLLIRINLKKLLQIWLFTNFCRFRIICWLHDSASVWADWVKFRNFGYFLCYWFSPKQAVSTCGLLQGFKSSLMWMFWDFKLNFEVDILAFGATFAKKLGKILFSFRVTLLSNFLPVIYTSM